MLKLINKQLDDLEEKAKPGGPLHRVWPIIDAQDTFLRVPKTRTSKGAHVRDFVSIKRMMGMVVFALIPCLLFGIYNAGYQRLLAMGQETIFLDCMLQGAIKVLPIVLVSYAVGGIWELIFALVRGHEINEGFLVTGMLFPLTLPPSLPLWMVALGVTFGVVIGKEVFGGTGMNILNPALTARAFVFFAYPAQMSGEVWTAVNVAKDKVVDSFSGASPLGIAMTSTVNEGVVDKLTEAGFTFPKIFIGLIPGSIGETSTFLCVLGALILISVGVGSWKIMLSMLGGGVVMSILVSAIAGPESSGLLGLPFYYQICLGGFAFGLVYMATDPVSAAGTETGKIIYGFITGCLAIIIRTLNPAYPEGVMLAILFMNIFAPLIDHYVVQGNVKRRLSRA